MKKALVALGCLYSLGVSWPQPLPNVVQLAPAQPTNTQRSSLVSRDVEDIVKTYGHWIHARAETTAETTAEATTATTTDTTQSITTEATTSTSSTSTTTTAGASTTSQTTSTTSTSSSTSTTTTATSTTSTASTTTSTATATATSTASAALAERNRKGTIAAIITFSLLGSLFVGICIVSGARSALAKKRKAAAAAVPQKRPVSGSTYSMVPLTDDAGRPTSEPRFDRTSIMFADSSTPDFRAYGTPRGSAYFDPTAAGGFVQDPGRRSEGRPSSAVPERHSRTSSREV